MTSDRLNSDLIVDVRCEAMKFISFPLIFCFCFYECLCVWFSTTCIYDLHARLITRFMAYKWSKEKKWMEMLVSWIVIGAGGFDQRISQIASMRLYVCVCFRVSHQCEWIHRPVWKKVTIKTTEKKLEFTY